MSHTPVPEQGATSRKRQLRLSLGLAGVAVVGLCWWLWSRSQPVRVAVGVDLPLVYGAAINPTDLNTAQLFREDNPRSLIQLVTMFNSADSEQGPADFQVLLDQGVRFFISTQASSHAVPSIDLFADGKALAINVSATSQRLSGRDDYFFRIIPDLAREQRAIAAKINQLSGSRLLVIQDTRNLAYTEPALKEFLQALHKTRSWDVTIQPVRLADFDPSTANGFRQRFDVLYILGGDFMAGIGNLAQLFHRDNPDSPIILTRWAHSPAVLENAGDARKHLLIASPYPSRSEDPRLDSYLQNYQRRFGYSPYAMGIGTRQALELLDQAFHRGHRTPAAVKRYLLSRSEHQTSFGPIRFDRTGDVEGRYHFLQSPSP